MLPCLFLHITTIEAIEKAVAGEPDVIDRYCGIMPYLIALVFPTLGKPDRRSMLPRIITTVLLHSRKAFLRENCRMRNIPPKPPVSMLFQPLLPNKRHEKSGQEMLCFLLAFFCTLYGNYPISVCWLILVYEQLPVHSSLFMRLSSLASFLY